MINSNTFPFTAASDVVQFGSGCHIWRINSARFAKGQYGRYQNHLWIIAGGTTRLSSDLGGKFNSLYIWFRDVLGPYFSKFSTAIHNINPIWVVYWRVWHFPMLRFTGFERGFLNLIHKPYVYYIYTQPNNKTVHTYISLVQDSVLRCAIISRWIPILTCWCCSGMYWSTYPSSEFSAAFQFAVRLHMHNEWRHTWKPSAENRFEISATSRSHLNSFRSVW